MEYIELIALIFSAMLKTNCSYFIFDYTFTTLSNHSQRNYIIQKIYFAFVSFVIKLVRN